MSEIHDVLEMPPVTFYVHGLAGAACINVGHPCPCGRGNVVTPHYASVLGVERADWMQCGQGILGNDGLNRPHRQPERYFLYAVSDLPDGELRVEVSPSRAVRDEITADRRRLTEALGYDSTQPFTVVDRFLLGRRSRGDDP